jgi:glyoxylase-like metal-dependent hydrolase (beta-lactamase superfamily II)
VINTSVDEDHIGGNSRLIELPENSPIIGVTFPPVGLAPSAHLISHENVLIRMSAPAGDSTVVPVSHWPTLTFREDKYKISEFFNGEGVQILHVPNAHTDGDAWCPFAKERWNEQFFVGRCGLDLGGQFGFAHARLLRRGFG